MCKFFCFFIFCFLCTNSLVLANHQDNTNLCKKYFTDHRLSAFDSKNNVLQLMNAIKRLKNFRTLDTSFLLDMGTKQKYILISPTSRDFSDPKATHHAKEELLDLNIPSGKVQVAHDETHNPLLNDLLLQKEKTSNLLKERALAASKAIENDISESADIKKWEHRFVKAWSFMFFIPPTAGIVTSYFAGFEIGIPLSLISYYPVHLLRKFIIKQLESHQRLDYEDYKNLPKHLQSPNSGFSNALHDHISKDIAHHFIAYSNEQDPNHANVLVVPHTLKDRVLHYLKSHIPSLQHLDINDLQSIYEEYEPAI